MGKKVYAVFAGKKPGIYHNWEDAKAQVNGFKNPVYRGFSSFIEAENWLKTGKLNINKKTEKGNMPLELPSDNSVIIYTDGACKKNPGPGGYGVLILTKEGKKEISEGFRYTTNNRMELLACIVALEELKKKSRVRIYTDSAYVVNSVIKGWAVRWRANGWKRNKNQYADNIDLWERFLNIYEQNFVEMIWVKGHANNQGNEICDKLASNAATNKARNIDINYEKTVGKQK